MYHKKIIWISLFSVINHGLYLLNQSRSLPPWFYSCCDGINFSQCKRLHLHAWTFSAWDLLMEQTGGGCFSFLKPGYYHRPQRSSPNRFSCDILLTFFQRCRQDFPPPRHATPRHTDDVKPVVSQPMLSRPRPRSV